MKRIVWIALLSTVGFVALLPVARMAIADEVKLVGAVTKINMAQDGKLAVVTLKDNKTGELRDIIVTDELTLDKLKDHRIVEGDEIRCKFEVIQGKNNSKYFRKTAGC